MTRKEFIREIREALETKIIGAKDALNEFLLPASGHCAVGLLYCDYYTTVG